jgi:hypothetical protein
MLRSQWGRRPSFDFCDVGLVVTQWREDRVEDEGRVKYTRNFYASTLVSDLVDWEH